MALAAKRTNYTVDDYFALPENVRAELIDGVLYNMASPSSIHQELCGRAFYGIYDYIEKNKGKCRVFFAPYCVHLDKNKDNYYEPDITVVCDPEKLTDKGCEGAPDWIIEVVSPSTAGHDYVKKLNHYMDAGVREYWIVTPENEDVIVYTQNDGVKDFTVYSFKDRIKAGIYDDLFMDFTPFVGCGNAEYES